MVPIVSGFDSVDGGNWQRWQYDLQLASTSLLQNVPTTDPTLLAEQIHQINPSYLSYRDIVERFLTDTLQNNLPVDHHEQDINVPLNIGAAQGC